jgi:NAD kinase
MYEKIVLVIRKTRLEGLVERFNTRAQARFYIEHSGGSFGLYEKEHETYQASLASLRRTLEGIAKTQVIERGYLPNFLFSETDLVVTIGIDGLVVNTAKYLDGQPLVAVNPDPKHIDGVLLPFNINTGPTAIKQVMAGKAKFRPISMAQATLNDGQSLLAFNDLFIGVKSHVSARYRIQVGAQEEHQSSSGIIVSTGAGSTVWLSSLFNMANGMQAVFGQAATLKAPALAWEADQLIFVVREPFLSKTSGASIVCGAITSSAPLKLESQIPEGGVIFSDGVESDFLAFTAGTIAEVGLSARKTKLVTG